MLQESEDTQPNLTILTVVLNANSTIRDCVESIESQKFPELEYIVIDGGSTDGTLEYLQTKVEIIDLLISEPDDGLYFAMNKGLEKARGKVIGILNADDRYASEAFLKIWKVFTASDQKSVIYGGLRNLESGSVLYVDPTELPQRMIPHPTVFVPRSLYNKYGTFNTNFKVAADYEFMARLYKNNTEFIKLNSVLAEYKDGGYSSQHKIRSALESFKIQSKILESSQIKAFVLLAKICLKIFFNGLLNEFKK